MASPSSLRAVLAPLGGRSLVRADGRHQLLLPLGASYQDVDVGAGTAVGRRTMSTGTRGSRGRGWFTNYRAGKGGRHLQGRYYKERTEEAVADMVRWNDKVFALNKTLKGGPPVSLDEATVDDPSSIPRAAYLELVTEDWAGEPRRVELELATAALPRTCLNFARLCTGRAAGMTVVQGDNDSSNKSSSSSFDLGYESTIVHMIEKSVGLCLGDVHMENGDSGQCHPSVSEWPNGRHFVDEGFLLAHGVPGGGIVSMLNSGVHRNDSRFLITTAAANHLDGRFVSFGRVRDGMHVVMDLTRVFTKRGRPASEIRVVKCGVLEE